MQKVIIIVGPTAVGKTALSISLAKAINGEIINGDSLQVYRQLNIGTAKITMSEMDGVPHHLSDICEVDEPFTASDFKEQARRMIEEISARGHVPIIVGGTGLYIEGLLYDFHYSGENSNDEQYRQKKQEELAQSTPEELWQELYEKDAETARTIHPNNTRRVLRALEVIHATGKPFSQMERTQQTPHYEAFMIGLEADRKVLYERINKRVDVMVEQGLMKEVEFLFQQSFSPEVQSVRGIGYKEWFPYLRGEESFERAKETVKQNSRRYAKRQFTWFRNRMKQIHWYNLLEEKHTIEQIINDCQVFLG